MEQTTLASLPGQEREKDAALDDVSPPESAEQPEEISQPPSVRPVHGFKVRQAVEKHKSRGRRETS